MRPPVRAVRRLALPGALPGALAVVVLALGAVGIPAQQPAGAARPEAGPAQDTARLEAARRLAREERYAAAADTLRLYLAHHPDDGGAQWLLGQVLERSDRPEAARGAYEAALTRLPAEPWLRIELAAVLLSLGEYGQVGPVLAPLVDGRSEPAVRARALTLMGRAAHWSGRPGRAQRRFREALAVDPGHEPARAGLREIRSMMRPWIRVGGALLDDTQPYLRYRGRLEGGIWVSPLWTVAGVVVPRLLDPGGEESLLGGPRRPGWPGAGVRDERGAAAAWLEVAGSLPGTRIGLRGRAGGWTGAGGTTWTGGGGVRIGLPGQLALRADASRRRYLATVASADTLVMVETAEVVLDRAAAPGLAGEAVARLERFEDGNTVRTAFVWVLAPVVRHVRVGYAAAWQDADENRWRLPAGTTEFEGFYDPYYTPEQLTAHMALGEIALGDGPVRLRVNGRYGFHATEQAPAPDTVSAVPSGGRHRFPGNDPTGTDLPVVFSERTFHPWEARVTVAWEPSEALSMELVAAREQTAFWRQNRLSVSTTYRFRARPIER